MEQIKIKYDITFVVVKRHFKYLFENKKFNDSLLLPTPRITERRNIIFFTSN